MACGRAALAIARHNTRPSCPAATAPHPARWPRAGSDSLQRRPLVRGAQASHVALAPTAEGEGAAAHRHDVSLLPTTALTKVAIGRRQMQAECRRGTSIGTLDENFRNR